MGAATDGVHVNGAGEFCHVVRGLFECRPKPVTPGRISLNDCGQFATIVQNALPQNAIIANCNIDATGTVFNYLILKDLLSNKDWHGTCNPLSYKYSPAQPPAENMPMNSALLLALNTVALAALVMFHFQSNTSEDAAQVSQAIPHHLQQRPQLAVMKPNMQSPLQLTQGTQAAPSTEHWVF
jgi:hypothetical protein